MALLLFTVPAAACGADGRTPSATGSPPPVSASASAAVAAATSATPVPTPQATPTPAPAYWPLTGALATDLSKLGRRPFNVRLTNDPTAQPPVGLSKADLVFEMIVEGGLTRYSAIFHSQDAKAAGPVRSYRWSDLHVTQLLRGVLVASGATVEERDGATRSIRAGNIVSVDAQRVGAPYYRVGSRPAPDNLFVDLTAAREAAGGVGGGDPVDVPPLAFFRSAEHDPTAGGFALSTPATSLTIPFQRDPVTFTYDEGSKGYRRSQAGTRTVDADGSVPIIARNVIVIHTDIWQTSVVEDSLGAKGLDYRMTDGGRAEIFRNGRRLDGTWKRDGVLDQFTFSDRSGAPVLLEPGQSWIHFVYPAWVVTSVP